MVGLPDRARRLDLALLHAAVGASDRVGLGVGSRFTKYRMASFFDRIARDFERAQGVTMTVLLAVRPNTSAAYMHSAFAGGAANFPGAIARTR